MRNSQQITELIITSKTLSAVCFLTIPGPGCSIKAGLRKPRRGGLVRNMNSDVKITFCKQVDFLIGCS